MQLVTRYVTDFQNVYISVASYQYTITNYGKWHAYEKKKYTIIFTAAWQRTIQIYMKLVYITHAYSKQMESTGEAMR